MLDKADALLETQDFRPEQRKIDLRYVGKPLIVHLRPPRPLGHKGKSLFRISYWIP